MYVAEVKDDLKWDSFINQVNNNTFLHSNSWIEFNARQANKVWKLGIFDSSNVLVGVALIIKVVAKRGVFLFCPHGPVCVSSANSSISDKNSFSKEMQVLVDYLKKLSKLEGASFVRLQPIVLKNDLAQNIFTELGFTKAPIHMHTEYTSLLDITPSIENLLLGMRKTTRQMIKKGEQLVNSGEVILEHFENITPEMQEVYESTTKRGGFVPYSAKFLKDELESFQKCSQVFLHGVRHSGQLLSWGMVLKSGKRAFYHQGANILSKDIPASYMCQWEGIKWAKQNGCESYDFWGVSPQDQTQHPWAKISMFKRGFGGVDVELLPAQDLVLNWKYWINWLIETRRAKKRGFVG